MRIAYDAVLEQPADAVWASLTDVDSVLAALPGAALARDGDGGVSGSVKCKLGSTQITYRVTARAEVGEASFRTTVLTVAGTEARGTGALSATLTVAVREGSGARIEVSGDISATGRGERADEAAWQRTIASMVNALVPPEVEREPIPVERPPLVVAPPPAEPAPALAGIPRPVAFGLLGAALLLLLRRIRRRRTAK
jgi:carbon monoxide dehydrogenase subunit G